MHEGQDLPLVDQRALRRHDVEESGGLIRRGASCSAVAGTVLTCGLFLADFATDAVVALPALWAVNKHIEFYALAASLAVGGAAGSAVATSELGIWGKIDRTPRWLRWHFVAAMCGLLPLVPLAVLVTSLGARACGHTRSLNACILARQWMECGGTLQLLLGLIVQVSATATYGVDLWISIAAGLAVLVKVAAEHDTHNHVYLWLTFREGKELSRDLTVGPSWEESVPLITGPLPSLLSPLAVLVLLFRTAEVVAQLGCLALFQAGTRNWLSIYGVSVGGLLLVGVQFALQNLAFRVSSEWMSAGVWRAFLSCVFIPKPMLDCDVPIMHHYVVMAASQAAVLGIGYIAQLPTELPPIVIRAILGCIPAMWLLLGLLRVVAGPGTVSGSAEDLADKVRLGTVELQPFTADLTQLRQLTEFCRAFCRHFFGDGFEYNGDVLRIDLSSSHQEVRSLCLALVMAEPLLKVAPKLELDLAGTHLKDSDIADLVEFLPRSAESIEINLADTQVGDVGVVRLAQMLPPNLRSLEVGLNSTSITDKGLAVLAQHLPRNLMSFELILYNTQVGDRGLAALAKHLPQGLANLRAGLYKTQVGDEGVIALAEKLPASLQIFRIELAGTQITDRGASALAERLPAGLVKFEANVSGTKVSSVVKDLLKEAASIPAFGGRGNKPLTTEVEEPPRFFCCQMVPFFNQA